MITTTSKAIKAVIFHWAISHWNVHCLAKTLSYKDMVSEMVLLDMEDFINMNPIIVYVAYKEIKEWAREAWIDDIQWR